MAKPYRGGTKPATHCVRGHRLTEVNTVKAGKSNNPRCRICRKRIVKASRKRIAKRKAESNG